MVRKKIETVCGYSCSDCEHYGNDCKGCIETEGRPFWTQYVEADACPVYACCTGERHLPHCGKCPEMLCERFTRFKDPGMTEEELSRTLYAMEQDLRSRE